MKLIDRDYHLFERLISGDIHLISSSIKRINISPIDEGGLVIEVDFELLYNSPSILRFIGVKEYSFYWNAKHDFYYVEGFKLIKKGNLFYVTFDPEDETSLDISEMIRTLFCLTVSKDIILIMYHN